MKKVMFTLILLSTLVFGQKPLSFYTNDNEIKSESDSLILSESDFQSGTTILLNSSCEKIDKFLMNYPNMKIQIQIYSDLKSKTHMLLTNQGSAINEYLVGKGINANRVVYKAKSNYIIVKQIDKQ